MVTSAGRTSVSRTHARHFLNRALTADHDGERHVARSFYLLAVQHDPTASSLLGFGQFLADNSQLEDAVTVLTDAWQLARRIQDPSALARACRLLASVHRELGNSPLARRFLQRSAAAEMRTWSADQVQFSTDQLLCESTFAADCGELERARALCLAALGNADGAQRCAVLRQATAVAIRMDDARSALQSAVSATRVALATNDPLLCSECALELGHVLRWLQRGRAALACYLAATERLKDLPPCPRRSQALQAIRELRQELRTQVDPSLN